MLFRSNAEVSEKRKRTFLRCPVQALAALGIDANAVEDVILTHLHYDHVGNFDRFPKARFHLQERELAYATGRYMRYPRLSHSFEVEDVCGIVRLNYAGRVMFYDGDAELAPGLTVHAVGGHSAGLQFVRIKTRRGFVVLASDVTHFYENMASSRPFTTAFHIGEMLEGFCTCAGRGPRRPRARSSGDEALSGPQPRTRRCCGAPGRAAIRRCAVPRRLCFSPLKIARE